MKSKTIERRMQALEKREQELEDKRFDEACERLVEWLSDAELSKLEALAILTEGGEKEQGLTESDWRFLNKVEALARISQTGA